MTTVIERPGETRAGHDNRRRLVVIGNGMAGARVVEEILARGGAEQFSITIFGEEQYGNYNRIMLSHVRSGEESHDDIFLNSLEWYVDNGITLHSVSGFSASIALPRWCSLMRGRSPRTTS
jgi:nitrite reductase (NADH) large subunit